MHIIGEKILEKINDRAKAAGQRPSQSHEDPIATEAFELLHNAYDWCYTLIDDILEEIEDEEVK